MLTSSGRRRDGRRAGCNGLIIHSLQKNSSGHTFGEDLQLERFTARVKYLFYDRAMRGLISRDFYVRHLQNAKMPHFSPQRRRLMSEPPRCKVGVECWSVELVGSKFKYLWQKVIDTRLVLKKIYLRKIRDCWKVFVTEFNINSMLFYYWHYNWFHEIIISNALQ